MSWLSRIANVFRSEQLDSQLDDEFRFHLEERIDHLIDEGMTRREAERQARRQFGNHIRIRETSHDVKAFAWLESIFRDIHFGCRVLWKDRSAMGAAALSLAFALGACSTAFSLLDALILRPLPVSHPEDLISVAYTERGDSREHASFSYPLFQLFKQTVPRDIELFGTAGGGRSPARFNGPESDAEQVRIDGLSGNAFAVLGIQPARGRLLRPDDDIPQSSSPVAVLSHAFWTRRFGSDPTLVGRWIEIGDRQVQIVGIAQDTFDGLTPGYLTDIWVPLTALTDPRTIASASSTWVGVWGRVNSGDTAGRVKQTLQTVFTSFRRDHVQRSGDDGGALPLGASPEQVANYVDAQLVVRSAETGDDSLFRRQFHQTLWIFGIFSALLLLIAASNVANLFIARGVGREREMALRIALGSGRRRLLRQLLIESGILALVACALGIGFGAAAAPFLTRQLGASAFPAYLDVRPDWRLVGFMACAATLATLLFGAIPAFRASAVNPDEALKSSAKQSGRIGALRPLLAVQVAFSFMVLFLSGLLLISFEKLIHLDLGFAKDRVILFTLNAKGLSPSKQAPTETALIARVKQINGVLAAGLSQQAPIGGAFAFVMTPFVRLPGGSLDAIRPVQIPVSPGFFSTMQIRLIAGREFEGRDAEIETSPAVLVNTAFAEHFFPGQNCVGQVFETMGDRQPLREEIVGVVANSLFNNLREPVTPTFYTPLRNINGAALEVRTGVNPLLLGDTLRREIEAVDPSLHVRGSILQSTRIDDTLVSERLLAWIAGFFALAAAILVAVGLHGVISYFVVRRTKEIGIRMALGAERTGVVRLVISQVATLIFVGIAIGAVAGQEIAGYAGSLLFGVKPVEFLSLAAPLAVLLIACVAAALRPALRATRVDPVIALRYE